MCYDKHMKKFALAGFVIVAFALYTIHDRIDGSQSVVASSVSPNNTATSAAPSVPPSTSTTPSAPTSTTSSQYKDGTYTGTSADAVYGYIQVRATISNGKIVDVEFLDHPQDRRTSVEINTQAMPMLKQQAIQAQTAKVDGVSGATDTSMAFIQSLSAALGQAAV